jgi:hypothetical protein
MENDYSGEQDESEASQHVVSMPDALFEIEIPHRFFGRLVFSFLEGFLEFAIEDVFLLAFGFPGIAEFIFALARLLGQDARSIVDIDVRRGFWRSDMREHDGKFRIHRELGLAARADHFNGRCGFLHHPAILRQKWIHRGTLRRAARGAGIAAGSLDFPFATGQNPFMALEFTTDYVKDSLSLFRYYKRLGDGALEQTPDDALLTILDAESNSIATIVKHMAGNMRSRWTDFLVSDGEKPDRHRDTEFETPPATRAEVMALWEANWKLVFEALEPLTEADLGRQIPIRGEAHSVMQAINRQMGHYAYHVGQIVYLAKHFAGSNWKTLSVPRRKSAEYNERVASGKASQR